jgi:cyclic pyranopterin phosphate synthase
MAQARLSHVGRDRRARMVDVGAKPVTEREARASARVRVSPGAMALVRADALEKGSVVEVARIAGIQAAKRTSDAIPLCHPLSLSFVDVRITARRGGLAIDSVVRTSGRTGAEMEALHAVAIAALTVYDMVKAVDKRVTIEAVRLEAKSGGRSGDWKR